MGGAIARVRGRGPAPPQTAAAQAHERRAALDLNADEHASEEPAVEKFGGAMGAALARLSQGVPGGVGGRAARAVAEEMAAALIIYLEGGNAATGLTLDPKP